MSFISINIPTPTSGKKGNLPPGTTELIPWLLSQHLYVRVHPLFSGSPPFPALKTMMVFPTIIQMEELKGVWSEEE